MCTLPQGLGIHRRGGSKSSVLILKFVCSVSGSVFSAGLVSVMTQPTGRERRAASDWTLHAEMLVRVAADASWSDWGRGPPTILRYRFEMWDG